MVALTVLPGGAERRNREFINDVLAGLDRRQLRFRGCRPVNVTWALDGTVSCHFVGTREGRLWTGAVNLKAVLPPGLNDMEITAAASPEAIVEACAEAVARIHDYEAGRRHWQLEVAR